MTPKSKVVLRTAFNDEFHVGDVVITQSGTEVDRTKATEIVEAARRSGVTLTEIEEADVVEVKKTEGGGS